MTKWLLPASALLALGACGGGDPAPPGPTDSPAALRATQTVKGTASEAPSAAAATVSSSELAASLMNFAEATYPSLFPGHPATQSVEPFLYRYYPQTGVYLGVSTNGTLGYVQGGVYLAGKGFGDWPRYMGLAGELLPTNFTVAFNDSTLQLEAFAGETLSVQIAARLTPAYAQGSLYLRIEDSAKQFAAAAAPTLSADGAVSGTMSLANPTESGQGQFVLRLCRDSGCKAEHGGSPARLSYTLKVSPVQNLTPIARLSGVGEWAMHQAEAAHTGRVPATLDASRFNRRWRWVAPDATSSGTVSPAVTADGKVYLVASSGSGGKFTLYALNESNAQIAWTYAFGTIFNVNPPAVSGGKVFAASTGHSDTFMWSFDAVTGTLRSKQAFGSQWEHYYAPTLYGGAVYTNGGGYGGLLSFKASDGTQNWFAPLAQYDEWTPAVDASAAYAFVGGSLYALDRNSGSPLYSIADPAFAWDGWSVEGAPAIGSSGIVVSISGVGNTYQKNRLVAFDVTGRKVKWSVAGTHLREPALTDGEVFTVNGNQLESRRLGDGGLSWSWKPSEPTSSPFNLTRSNIVVAANLVFVSSDTTVYAVSRDTHKTVWSFPRPGRLTLSPSGLLYIATPTGSSNASLTAINLQ